MNPPALPKDSDPAPWMVTSWNNAAVGSGSVVNEIVSEYNDFRQLKKEYQSLSGATNEASTPFVEYAYANGGNNTVRRTSITYPDGRTIGYTYDSGIDDLTDRVSGITDSATVGGVATYLRRGVNSTVQINYTQPGIVMSYIGTPGGDGGDQYVGLDRFDRIIDIPWKKSSTDLARYQYGFSRASNRLWRKDVVGSSSGYDEAYAYDGLYQLSQRKRGTLSGSTIPRTPVAQEDFGYDPIGNWNGYETRASGTLQLDQSRLHNPANEITQIDGAGTLVGYDATGNMTTTPKPSNWSAGWTLTWDAWNRLMTVSDAGGLKETYAYDGLSRRTMSVLPSTFQRGYFYSDQWQVLEERTGTGSLGSSVVRQYIWGLRYIDDLILRDVLSTDSPAPTGRLYALHDQWHVVAITDNTGAVQERYSYSAAGMTQVLTPAYANRSSSSFGWNITYGAYRWDAESGFYQARYRYVHPNLGRWLSRDPIGEEGGINLYCMVKNRFPNAVDFFGLDENEISLDDLFKDLNITDPRTQAAIKKRGCSGIAGSQIAHDPGDTIGSPEGNVAAVKCYTGQKWAEQAAKDPMTGCKKCYTLVRAQGHYGAKKLREDPITHQIDPDDQTRFSGTLADPGDYNYETKPCGSDFWYGANRGAGNNDADQKFFKSKDLMPRKDKQWPFEMWCYKCNDSDAPADPQKK